MRVWQAFIPWAEAEGDGEERERERRDAGRKAPISTRDVLAMSTPDMPPLVVVVMLPPLMVSVSVLMLLLFEALEVMG